MFVNKLLNNQIKMIDLETYFQKAILKQFSNEIKYETQQT